MAKFDCGQHVATPGALDALVNACQSPIEFINRHVNGDWGNLSDGDKQLNDEALTCEDRILSKYQTALGVDLYVITEWDRSVTTILLPSEY